MFSPEPGLIPFCERLLKECALVVVVDDGSYESVGVLGRLPEGFVLIKHDRNCGKGR